MRLRLLYSAGFFIFLKSFLLFERRLDFDYDLQSINLSIMHTCMSNLRILLTTVVNYCIFFLVLPDATGMDVPEVIEDFF